MKSIYQDKDFADYWNIRSGQEGEPYKKVILDPEMIALCGALSNKSFLELGCGNGYLAKTILSQAPESLALCDISEHNLRNARLMINDNRVTFHQIDITKGLPFKSESIDVIYSSMVFSEIDQLDIVFRDCLRILSSEGVFVFSILHPGWDIYEFAQKECRNERGKIRGVRGYFDRGYSRFTMGQNNNVREELREYSGIYEVEHYQRPLSDYVNLLISCGFKITGMSEPEIPETFIEKYPNFSEYKNFPITLVIRAIKE